MRKMKEERNEKSVQKARCSLIVSAVKHSHSLSSSYEKSLDLSMLYIICITLKVITVGVHIYVHQPDLVHLIHQDIQFRDNISMMKRRMFFCG